MKGPHDQAAAFEFGRDQRGGVAIFFGFALPVLLVGAGAAVEYASLTHRRGQLQKAADTAALTAARELTLANADDARVKSVAQGAAIASLTEGKQGGTSATVAAEVMDKRGGVRVTIHETITNIFGKVLTLPSSELEVRAAAKLSGGGRLCVMALDPTKGEAIRLDQNAKLTANGCSVQSNSKDRKGISAREYAFLSAERICSAGGYEGKAGANVSPAPTADCPTIPDPLAKRGTPTVGGCDYGSLVPLLPKVVDGKTTTLNPGTYCGGLVITNKSNVTLSQGEYIIHQGPLIVEKGSTLTGEYVGFFLKGDLATLNFKSELDHQPLGTQDRHDGRPPGFRRPARDLRAQVPYRERQRPQAARNHLPAEGLDLHQLQEAGGRPVRLHGYCRAHDRARIRAESRHERQLRRDRRTGPVRGRPDLRAGLAQPIDRCGARGMGSKCVTNRACA